MSGRWWRAYSRARHDPKLLKLSDRHFRWWFNLVSVAADNDGMLPDHADLAVEFRVAPKAMTEALDALVSAGLFDHDDSGIHPHNWNGLQYKHDVSTERVKRFRQRRETVSETPSESETEAETDRPVAKATGADAPDTKKLAFDAGVKILTASGLKEPQARSLIGKWRKDHGDQQVLAAIGSCQRSNVSEPVSWITATFKAETAESRAEVRDREASAAIARGLRVQL